MIHTFAKYKQNLKVIGDKLYSYNTHVATIQYPNLIVPKWYSKTTSKHVNYIAQEYNLNVVKEYE
jgi:hypothetical protein